MSARVLSTFQRFFSGPTPAAGSGNPGWIEREPCGDGASYPDLWEERRVRDRRQSTHPMQGGRRASDYGGEGAPARSGRDRRKESRYIPYCRRAYLGWWAGDEYRTLTARIENLSRSGAALLVDEFPESVSEVWLCLIGPVRADWYPARMVGIAPSGGVGRVVRIALDESLSYEVFKSIVWGLPGDAVSAVGTVLPIAAAC